MIMSTSHENLIEELAVAMGRVSRASPPQLTA